MLRNILCGLATSLFVIAFWFSLQTPKWQHYDNGVQFGPDAISESASAGFAIAGGLTMIAAVIALCFDRIDRGQ